VKCAVLRQSLWISFFHTSQKLKYCVFKQPGWNTFSLQETSLLPIWNSLPICKTQLCPKSVFNGESCPGSCLPIITDLFWFVEHPKYLIQTKHHSWSKCTEFELLSVCPPLIDLLWSSCASTLSSVQPAWIYLQGFCLGTYCLHCLYD
jgi:hypothetical protein